ncbi:MAG: hypothetical protein GY857_03840, partial [Desulfobacula sp.]|nr:hypothetical protein [Desulfobacula sp.]
MEFNLFRFFISGVKKEVLPDSDLWQLPLSGKNSRQSSDSDFTTGDYYLAACRFLSKNNFSILQTALGSFLSHNFLPGNSVHDISTMADQISRIEVFLEKHGAFYHPMRIKVILHNDTKCLFVLNGAVSKQGIALIKKEHELLLKINKNQLRSYLPQVYGFDFIKVDGVKVGFFLGQWLENYKEFHVSDDNGAREISIWNSNGSCHYIQMGDAFEIYRKIAGILTHYYNIETFEQISSWHHAAGDFIVSLEDGKLSVKLITIRAYQPLTQIGAGEKNQKTYILPSLLLFFLNMTIRIRLDRLNGTGEMVMIDQLVLNDIIKGFLSALDEKSVIFDYGDLSSAFIEFFLRFE